MAKKNRVEVVATIRDEKGVLTVSGKSEEAIAEAVAHLHRQELREAARRERWGEGGAEGMQRLCRLFPTLRGVPGTDPWEWDKLLEWLTGPAPTSGSTWAALFVLGVWNPTTDWSDMAQELPLRACRRCDGAKRLNETATRTFREAAHARRVRAPGNSAHR